MFKEFEEIPKKVQSAECSVARLPENEVRNRFKDVLPYDITRVKLTPRKDNHSGYINGSHIKVKFLLWFYTTSERKPVTFNQNKFLVLKRSSASYIM